MSKQHKLMGAVSFLIINLILVTILGACAPAGPSQAEEFYKTNTVTMIAPAKAGGATDFSARLIADQWAEASGGGTMRVINVSEAGGIVGVNQVYNAEPDGLTIGVGSMGSRVAGPMVYKDPGMQFDSTKFNYLVQYADEPWCFAISPLLPYNSITELQQAKGLKLSGQSKTSGDTIGNALISYLFDLDAIVITGYGGAAEIGPACAKGELDGQSQSAGTLIKQADQGFVKPAILSLSFRRATLFPDAPAISEAMNLTPDQENMLKIFSLANSAAHTVYATPGIPADRLDYLRDSFAKMMDQPGFQEGVTNRFGSFTTPLTGDEVSSIINDLAAIPQADIDKIQQAIAKYIK